MLKTANKRKFTWSSTACVNKITVCHTITALFS